MAERKKTVGCAEEEDGCAPVLVFPEEIILEIIYCLPIKLAIQCRCLSKGFNKLISHPKFAQEHAIRSNEKALLLHYSSTAAKIFGLLSLSPVSSHKYITLFEGDCSMEGLISPLTSSNGRLLLRFRDKKCFYVFNPLTGAYRVVPLLYENEGGVFQEVLIQREVRGLGGLGLVDDKINSSFRLVAAVIFGGRLKFSIFEPNKNEWSRWKSWDSSLVNLHCEFAGYFQPVLVDNCLHWLLENGDVLGFDLNNEEPRIILKPDGADNIHVGQNTWFGVDTWLGMAEGYLTYVIAQREKIVICGYDSRRKLWQTKYTIENLPHNLYRNGRPVLWDGKTLIHLAGMELREIYKYEIQEKIWKKIEAMSWWTDHGRSFHSFVPTLATVPGCRYIHENAEPSEHQIIQKLVNFRSFLTGIRNGFVCT